MTPFLMAVLCAVIGLLPLACTGAVRLAAVLGVIVSLLLWPTFYLTIPSSNLWPLFGFPGFLVLVGWIVSALIANKLRSDTPARWTLLPPAFALLAYAVTLFSGWGAFRARDYASLIGQVQERVWTQDIQPKDPNHMRMVTRENAIYLANKVIGEAGSIGSQFQLAEEYTTLQTINGELWYVIPLDFSEYSTWSNVDEVPCYAKVHAEDPARKPELVSLPKGQGLQVTPGAFFSANLERHLYTHGYASYGLAEFQFEVDDDGKVWWIVSLFKPTIAWSGEKVVGIAMVNPANGDAVFKGMQDIPAWVDRVIPSAYVKEYIADWGKYSSGWWNSIWAGYNLSKPEAPGLIYGSEHQPDWVTGVTSTGKSDDSLIGVMYTNSRTGKAVLYRVKGGATDEAVIEAVNKNQNVQYKHLHAADPQIYNVYGTMASMVPLLSENHMLQGSAIVDTSNVQLIAVGSNQHDALREYQKLLSRGGQQIALDKTHQLETIDGVIDRVHADVGERGSVYYLHLKNVPRLFTGSSADFQAIPVTEPGDSVHFEYYASGEDVVPLHAFRNTSLPLGQTLAQEDVHGRLTAGHDHEEAVREADTVVENIKQMSPEAIRELGKKMPAAPASVK